MYSVMWSEHCSYKSSKVHLKQFSDIPQETPVGKMLAGIGENAGVIDIGQGYAVTFKVESHNHPSYVEPYQGAATGVGGIVRDILAMGARPVAVMDPLRFGPLDADDTHRVLPGIVAGIGGYGNCLGLPNIGGETVFDPTLPRQPPRQRAVRRRAPARGPAPGQGQRRRQPGDPLRRQDRRRRDRRRLDPGQSRRSRTRDRRSGRACRSATRSWRSCSSSARSRSSPPAWWPASRTSAAPASPARPPSWPARVTAACTSSSTRVPLRDSTLAPEEILMSESQERMMAVVEPGDVAAFLAICAKWDVDATVVGEVTDTGRLQIDWHGERVVDVPPRIGRARRPDVPAPVRAARTGRTRCRPTAPSHWPGRPPATSCARRCCGWRAAPTCATSRGSPTSTTGTSAATPCSRSPATAG